MIRLGVLPAVFFAFSFSFDEIIIALFLTNTADDDPAEAALQRARIT